MSEHSPDCDLNDFNAEGIQKPCNCGKSSFAAPPCSAIYRDMWAVVFPDGRIVTGSDLTTEADAWRIALGWPGSEEIEDAKQRGAFAVKARLRYYSPNSDYTTPGNITDPKSPK